MGKLKLPLTILFTLLLAVGFYQALIRTDFSKIKVVSVVGVQEKNRERLESLAQKASGENFWKIKLQDLATPIQNDPWVESVEIKKTFPDKIKVQIIERAPVAAVTTGKGDFEYMDHEGKIFGPVNKADLAKQIVINGKNFLDNPGLKKSAIELIKQLPADGPLSQADISEMTFHGDKGFQIILSKTGMVVDLGKDNLSLRIERARKVVQYLEQHQISASHVDADYAKKVLVKVRKGR
jgi:cell division protein FtsQ